MTSLEMTTLPGAFCWTRFGVEAGQDIGVILARKEAERRANGGVFLWGVGNSVLPSLAVLRQMESRPRAVFSPIRSRPRSVDVAPDRLAVWTRGRDIDGTPWTIPHGSLVTSHADRALGRHYALVCSAHTPLRLDGEALSFRLGDLCNLRSGRPIGASQVTAIVRHLADSRLDGTVKKGPQYAAAMVVDLVPPYVVTLEAPVVVPTWGRNGDTLIGACWEARRHAPASRVGQLDLFG